MECWIKRIGVRGGDNNSSSIDLEPGLNIVVGPSNTGKTMIFELIDYIFGSDANLRSALQEYQVAFAEMEVAEASITFERSIGEKASVVKIRSTWEEVKTGDYHVNPRTQYDNSLNSVLLKLCGIDEEIYIAKNKKWETQRLTWRTLRHLFMVDESQISGQASILDAQQATARTGMLSAFLYFAQGDDYSDEFLLYDPEYEKARRSFYKTVLEKRQIGYFDLRESLEAAIDKIDPCQLEKNKENIHEIEEEINRVVDEIDSYRTKANEIRQEIVKENLALSQFEELKDQYDADLKRLNFIADGIVSSSSEKQEYECPICDSKVNVSSHPDVIKSAAGEYKRIKNALDGLNDTISAEKVLLDERHNELHRCEQEIDNRERTIKDELDPQRAALIETVSTMQKQFELASKIELINQLQTDTAKELTKLSGEDTTYQEYKPAEKFTEETLEGIRASLQESLTYANYPNSADVVFDLKARDMVLGGMSKKEFGQGYRAYLNTVMSLSLYSFLKNDGSFRPWLLVYDSPINVLKQPGEEVRRPMKEGLFDLMAQVSEDVQIIVFENDDLGEGFPDTANIIRFTKEESEGRYGFLLGYKEES